MIICDRCKQGEAPPARVVEGYDLHFNRGRCPLADTQVSRKLDLCQGCAEVLARLLRASVADFTNPPRPAPKESR
jgi:hypothetical protein